MADYQSIQEILAAYGKYTGLTTGTSMLPLLHHQKDNIIIVKPEGRLQKYDVALYVTQDGKYILHRVVEVHDGYYIITGDNLMAKEHVTNDMICGKLVGFYKNGKHYIDCEKNLLYKLYSRVWVALKPLRPAVLLYRRGVNFLKRLLYPAYKFLFKRHEES